MDSATPNDHNQPFTGGSDTDKASSTPTQTSENSDNGAIVTAIPEVSVTKERKPYRNSTGDQQIIDPGV